ncbi:hypothetical protein M011DRAFT_14911 [Sporormia fimetaria CBS 119925]|uniref:NTF2-domain-containing protein n=1 Tax=Sporormia fimetaria CBS 119925 TaxID=1340428 RepID=A0A6A6VQI1_9PLEO|nr:hypothetical protein M011DRAFT_14911 [Sporormia fimetaria CBS 119925]
MATTDSAVPVNGTYAHHGYEANNYAAANANNGNTYTGGQPQQSATTNAASTSEIPKEEIGWYFVEQYYTTLSKTPERLSLFYNKRSHFVSGTEEEKVPVCTGQRSISDRIAELDFQETKVRVTNVDSQGSDANIVIQVIGEMSVKGHPHKKFVQTFVLAEQTNGYFVLNDIFRYLADEPEEAEDTVQEAPVSSDAPEPATSAVEEEAEPAQEEAPQNEGDLATVDKKLEEVAKEEEPTIAADVNGSAEKPTEAAVSEETPAAAAPTEEAPKEEAPKEPEAPAAEEATKPEEPKEPAPTPAAVPEKPAAPAKPAAPRTWATLLASSKPTAPAAPAPAAQQTQAAPKPAAQAPTQAQATPAAQPAPAPEASPSSNSQGEAAAGWQSVGHKKEPSRAQNQGPNSDNDGKRGYIKNVFPQVEESALRAALSKYGEVLYVDINRTKSCAFLDFKTPAGFQAAMKASPHNVNGVDLTVEERRPNPRGPFPHFQRGNGPRGRGGMNQGPPRGGYNTRGGRGGAGGRGGRPAPQDA